MGPMRMKQLGGRTPGGHPSTTFGPHAFLPGAFGEAGPTGSPTASGELSLCGSAPLRRDSAPRDARRRGGLRSPIPHYLVTSLRKDSPGPLRRDDRESGQSVKCQREVRTLRR